MLSLVVSLIRENRSSQSCGAEDTASDDGDNGAVPTGLPPGAGGSPSSPGLSCSPMVHLKYTEKACTLRVAVFCLSPGVLLDDIRSFPTFCVPSLSTLGGQGCLML